jgi:2',3'-cyclic-nucleotide 2'-phosphodiesterase (5'-nucleotidase family)
MKMLVHLLLAGMLAGSALAQAPAHFRILQINDVYKIEGLEGGKVGGLARLRTLRKHLESDGTPVLMLHAGDALYPSVMSKHLRAEPIVDVMNRLDGDAKAFDSRFFITFGNHEFDNKNDAILRERIAQSQFRWLSTNMQYCENGANCRPYSEVVPAVHSTELVDLGGVKVGLIGLLYSLEAGKAPQIYGKTTTTDVAGIIAAANAAAAKLRKAGARVVIAVTHEDMDDDLKLAMGADVDLIIGGHDHIFQQEQKNGRWVSKADADAKSAVVYDVVVPASGRIRTVPVRVSIDDTIAADPDVDNVVQCWMLRLRAAITPNPEDVVATTENLLEGVEPAVRGRETALGDLLAEIAKWKMKTDIGLMNGGGIRINDNILPGSIRNYDLEGIFYFANQLVSFPLTGQQIVGMLNNSVSKADKGDGRFLQVAGIRFKYRKTDTGFVVAPGDVTINDEPLQLDRTYSIGTVKYLWEKGVKEGYTMLDPPPPLDNPNEADQPDFRAVTLEYFNTLPNKVVTQKIDGRIERVMPPPAAPHCETAAGTGAPAASAPAPRTRLEKGE